MGRIGAATVRRLSAEGLEVHAVGRDASRLAAVSEDARLQRLAFWLSLGGMAAYNVEWLATALGRDWLESDSYRVLGSLVMLGPAAIAGLPDARSDPFSFCVAL